MARGCCADAINELCGVAESTVNYIFKKFITTFVNEFFNDYVINPVGADLANIMETYRLLGLPGCIGSMDVTHVPLLRCPKDARHLCTGKEKYPTLAFQVVVDHNRRITNVSRSFFGACSDKMINNDDDFSNQILKGILLYACLCFILNIVYYRFI
jgi:hypothetical protein